MRQPGSKGFTLMESLVALAVAALALTALLHLQLVSMHVADKAEGLTQAVLLAQEKLAEGVSRGCPAVGVTSGTAQAANERFDWRMEVTQAPLPPVVTPENAGPSYRPTLSRDRLRQLTVEVSWQKGPGLKQISLTTLVAEDPGRAG
jgi:general secretion pathway protein I